MTATQEQLEQAFPATDAAGYISRGMTLRDYFAAHVIGAVITANAERAVGIELMVAEAYEVADAMLTERAKV